MLGARDMVFPYVNMLSYWIYLLAVLVLVASFFLPEGPTGGGWTLYPPQVILTGTPGESGGIILMLASLALFIIGFTMGGLNYVVTVLQGRCRGMTLMRMPLTVWGIFTATVLALLAFPALFVGAVMLLFDRLLGTSFFMPTLISMGEKLSYGGGSPILFQHLFWFFGDPGSLHRRTAAWHRPDLIATHAEQEHFGYRMMVWAIVIIGALSFIVWAHHMYVSGMNPYFGYFFATTTLIIAIPTAIKVYNWVLTLWRGNIHLTVPMLFALGFIVTFVNGGLTGLFLGNVSVDVPLSDTMFVVAHFHMVMGVAPIMVIFGAIYHWYPKITGRMLNAGLGKIHFWITFLGAYLIFFPMHYVGLMGIPRRYHDIGDLAFVPASAHSLNEFISIMALIVGVAQIIFLFNLFWSLRHGKEAGGNPWRATTLEWQTRKRRLNTATGARTCRSSTAGPTTTAFQGRRRTSSSAEPTAGGGAGGLRLRRGLHPPLHDDHCSHRGVVAVAAAAVRQAVAGGLGRRVSRHRRVAIARGEDRPRRVSRSRRVAVRAVSVGLSHAHGNGGLAAVAGADRSMAQYGPAHPEQRGAAMGADQRPARRCRSRTDRPARRRSTPLASSPVS